MVDNKKVDNITAQAVLRRLVEAEYQKLFEMRLKTLNPNHDIELREEMRELLLVQHYFLELLRKDENSGK